MVQPVFVVSGQPREDSRSVVRRSIDVECQLTGFVSQYNTRLGRE